MIDDPMTDIAEITMQIEIISTSYTIKDNEAIIELYGRSRDGKSIVALARGFRPYCYFKYNEVSTRQILREFEKNVRHELVELEHGLKQEKYVKLYTDIPATIPKIRNKYDKDTPFMSADILFPLRYIYDMGLGFYVEITGEPAPSGKYTVDAVWVHTIKNCDSFQRRPTILSLDIETSILKNNILTICIVTRDHDGNSLNYKLLGDEPDIIKQFVSLVNEIDPDIITGYNIIFYDLPKIEERAKLHRIPVTIGRNDRSMWFKDISGKKYPQITGRIVADAWLHTKNLKKPRRETLNFVSKKYLGEEKMDVDSRQIDSEWEKDKEKVVEYCLKDTDLALRLLEYIKIIDKNISLAEVANLPLDTVFEGRTSSLADSLLIRMADRTGYAVPCTRKDFGRDKIKGGYVRDTKPGLYSWVIVLDFRSMYPSIIIDNNLCLTTYAPEIGDIITPIGARFLSPDIREGMVPKIMTKLMADRAAVKQQLKDAKKNHAPQNEIDYLDDLQYSIKVLANSFYGLFTSAFYRFTNPKIGASITAFARENIKKVIETLEKEGLTILAADTDSVFFKSPYAEKEKSIEFGKAVSKKFSGEVFELEFEKIYEAFFTHGKKKRYFGKIVWPNEEEDVKGYETKRRDSFDLLTDTLEQVFTMVLNNRIDDAVALSREVVQQCKSGNVPIDKLVISKSVRPENEYANPDALVQVHCARKMREMNQIVAPYMSISWIVTNARYSPQVVEPYIPGIPFEKTPDWNYYVERLARGLARITEVFGWDEDRLLTGTHQKDLFSYD